MLVRRGIGIDDLCTIRNYLRLLYTTLDIHVLTSSADDMGVSKQDSCLFLECSCTVNHV